MKSHAIRMLLPLFVLLCSMVAHGDDAKFFDFGGLALWARDGGVFEPAVPIYYNDELIDGQNHKLIDANDQVPGTGSFPTTMVDIHANTYLRVTYQMTNGTSGVLGTSVIGSPSYRTDEKLNLFPTVSRGDVFTDGAARYRSVMTGMFTNEARATTTRTFADPEIGRTVVDLEIQFEVLQPITLANSPPFPGNDRFRLLTASSMFSEPLVFDGNVVRYEDANGAIQKLDLSGLTPRDHHLWPVPVPIGSWFEIVKAAGETRSPSSPTIRMEILHRQNLRLGLQGFLVASTNPNDDSLNVWLEWLDAPNVLTNGSVIHFSARIIATPPVDSPPLRIQSSGANVTLSWPVTASRYSLEATTNLGESFKGLVCSTVTNELAGTISATLPAPETTRYFRLKKP